jgi:hypothetical protein
MVIAMEVVIAETLKPEFYCYEAQVNYTTERE